MKRNSLKVKYLRKEVSISMMPHWAEKKKKVVIIKDKYFYLPKDSFRIIFFYWWTVTCRKNDSPVEVICTSE